MTHSLYEHPVLVPTGFCSCDKPDHHVGDTCRRDGRRQGCCLTCYAHWWTDAAGIAIDCNEPFSPYTYTLAAMGVSPAPPPTAPHPRGLFARVTHLNFWRTTLNPEYGSFPGDWQWLERSAQLESTALSPEFELRHKSGDAEALLEFARYSAYALKESWVIDQLVAWRVDGTPDALARFKAVTTAMTDTRGRGSAKSGQLRENVRRNLRMFSDIVTRVESGDQVTIALSKAAEAHGLEYDTTKEIYEEYQRARKWHSAQPRRDGASLEEFLAWMEQLASCLPAAEDQ